MNIFETDNHDGTIVESITSPDVFYDWLGVERATAAPWLWTRDSELKQAVADYPGHQYVAYSSDHVAVGALLARPADLSGIVPGMPGVATVISRLLVPSSQNSTAGREAWSLLLNQAIRTAAADHSAVLLAPVNLNEAWLSYGLRSEDILKYTQDKQRVYAPRPGMKFTDMTIQQYAAAGFRSMRPSVETKTVYADVDDYWKLRREYKPLEWKEVQEGIWHCHGTGGVWEKIKGDTEGVAIYSEPYVWMGRILG